MDEQEPQFKPIIDEGLKQQAPVESREIPPFVSVSAPPALFAIGLLIPIFLMAASYYYYTVPTLASIDIDLQRDEFLLEDRSGTTYTLNYIVGAGRSLESVRFIDNNHEDQPGEDYVFDIRDLEFRGGGEWDSGGIISFSIAKIPCEGGCSYQDDGEIVGGWNASDGVLIFDDGESHSDFFSGEHIRIEFKTADTDLYQENYEIWEENSSNIERAGITCCLAPFCSFALFLGGLVGIIAGRHEMWIGALVSLSIYVFFLIFMFLKVFEESNIPF